MNCVLRRWQDRAAGAGETESDARGKLGSRWSWAVVERELGAWSVEHEQLRAMGRGIHTVVLMNSTTVYRTTHSRCTQERSGQTPDFKAKKHTQKEKKERKKAPAK